MVDFDGLKEVATPLPASVWAVTIPLPASVWGLATNLSASTWAVAALMAVSVWAVPVSAQPAPSEILGPGGLPVLEMRESGDAAAGSRHLAEANLPAPSPSELRSLLLYGGREFYSFQHSSPGAARRSETRILKRSFDPQIEDRWLAFDKVQHVTFSFLWTLGTQYVIVNKGRISEQHALPVSISSSALVGVSKEYYDLEIGPTNYFSYKDLAADALGILLATGVILL